VLDESALLCFGRSFLPVSVCAGTIIAERMLREDEKRNRRFFDGHMVESEANLQRELERERCLLLLHPRFRFVNL